MPLTMCESVTQKNSKHSSNKLLAMYFLVVNVQPNT
jgi:hypothetical protein